MAINTETLYRKLYDNLSSSGYNPTAENAKTGKEVVPEEADFLEFDFDKGDGSSPVTVSVEKTNDRYSLTVYFTDDVAEEGTDEWYNVLKDLRYAARVSGIKGFVLRNRNHLKPDMQKREYMKKQEQLAEGYYPMGKKASYSDAVPAVKIILQHSRQIEEGEQRYRNIAKIFVENQNGERFLVPTTKPGIARVYARHISEGGTPYDERGQHITSLVEEYSKMSGFVRATRGHQFNESAQQLVESGVAHYESLRETLSRMTGRRGYNMYFESWTPALMEDDTDTSSINELFVQETLDPRIESVMPILSRLSKNISEMKEVDALAEWADSLTEAPGAETLAHNQSTEKQNLKAFGLAEDDAEQEPAIEELDEEESLTSNNPQGIPEGEVEKTPTGLIHRKKDDKPDTINGIEKYAMDIDHLDKGLTSRLDKSMGIKWPHGNKKKGDEQLDEIPDTQFHEGETDGAYHNPPLDEVDLGQYDAVKTPLKGKDTADWDKNFREKLKQYTKELDQRQKEKKEKSEQVDEDEFAGDYKTGPAGQWRNKGPKANKPAKVGDLVGASESVESQDTMLEGQEDLDAILRIIRK